MTDPPFDTDSDDDTGVGPDREPAAGTPLWVKVFGILAIAVVVLLVVLLFAGGHGPGRHAGGAGGHTPPSSLAERGARDHAPPARAHAPR